jgi:hypothetical protein
MDVCWLLESAHRCVNIFSYHSVEHHKCFAVTPFGNSSQVTVQWNQAGSTTPISYYMLTVRPFVYQDNFTSTTLDSQWTVSLPDTRAVVSTTERPGYLRIRTTNAATFDMWTSRGSSPNVFRSYEAVGSWSASVYVDCTNMGIFDNVFGGLLVYEANTNAGLAPQYRLTYHNYVYGNSLACDIAGSGELKRSSVANVRDLNSLTSITMQAARAETLTRPVRTRARHSCGWITINLLAPTRRCTRSWIPILGPRRL